MSQRSPFHSILFLFFLLLTGFNVHAQTSRKVLFLGNSYTGVNNLPQLTADVAMSAGDTLIFENHHPGGYQLISHLVDTVSTGKIMAGGWDYVVAQGQSRESIISARDFRDGGRDLNNLITQYNPCAVTLFYMTWGRKNGDAAFCDDFPVVCTYEGMDSTIRNNYLQMSTILQAEVSPVSVVWNYLRQNNPGIELYQADGSHPSAAGSYAAACCFYASIFKKDPTSITFNFGLTAADAASIRNAAKSQVFDQLNTWDLKQPPQSDFRYTAGPGVNEMKFFCSNITETYAWDFGDGNTSTLQSPTHTYSSDGTYVVQLTTSNCDPQGLHTSVSDTIIQFCSHTPTVYSTNPWVCETDTLWTEPADSYKWIFNGRVLPETTQYLPDYYQYGGSHFSVVTSVNGCAELSQKFAFNPVWSGYYYDITPFWADPCQGDTLFFSVLHASGGLLGSEIIEWYKDGSLLPLHANKDTFEITSPGSYECKVIDSTSNCQLDTSSYLFVLDTCEVVGLADRSKTLSWHLFPNPASETLTIRFSNESPPVELHLFSAVGRLIRVIEASSSLQLDIADLPNGLYFIRVHNSEQPALKFIKQ